MQCNTCMKVKIFELALHKLPSGKAPTTALEELINEFLQGQPDIQISAVQVNSVVIPPQPHAMSKTEESIIVMFCTLFYTTLT